jgi:hypothetical protein
MKLLDFITPSNALFILQHKGLQGKTALSCTERWYGTKYNETLVSERQLSLWTSALTRSSKTSWDDLLHLPLPNMFIPTDFALKVADPNAVNDFEYRAPDIVEKVEVLAPKVKLELEAHEGTISPKEPEIISTEDEAGAGDEAGDPSGHEDDNGDGEGDGQQEDSESEDIDASSNSLMLPLPGRALTLWFLQVME